MTARLNRIVICLAYLFARVPERQRIDGIDLSGNYQQHQYYATNYNSTVQAFLTTIYLTADETTITKRIWRTLGYSSSIAEICRCKLLYHARFPVEWS